MLTTIWNDYRVNLVQSVDELREVLRSFSKDVMVGVDTETTGLDMRKCHTVGYCISGGPSYDTKSYQGYYIPVRHDPPYDDQNLPLDIVVKAIQWVMDNRKTIFFNRNFDLFFMEQDGVKIDFDKQSMHDSQIMTWEADQESRPKLKEASRKNLKKRDGTPWDVMEYSSNGAKEGSFATVDPRVGYIYAAGDPVMTCMLGLHMWKKYPEIHQIYKTIDNRFLEAIRYCNDHTKIVFDYDIIEKLDGIMLRKIQELTDQIYQISGFPFKIASPKEKVDVLRRLGVPLYKKTESGSLDTSKDALKEFAEDFPICKLLVDFNSVSHDYNTYLKRIKQFKTEYPDGIKVAYQSCAAPTGRLACGKDSGNPYYAPLNMMGIAKMEVYKYVHEDELLGYRVDDVREGAIGKMKVKGFLRDAFTCPEGYVFLNADYAAQEMRITANLSGEPNFINPILSGSDIHEYVAKEMFGLVDKSHRSRVKIMNFSILYGATAHTIANRLGISVAEAQELYDRYFATMKSLKKWKDHVIEDSKRTKMVKTVFGRPRSLAKKNMYLSTKRGDIAFGERTAVNSQVQGTGGDLARRGFIRLHKLFLENAEWRENVIFHSQVHDEFSLLVKPHYLKKAYDTLKWVMEFRPDGWKVPIISEPAIGYSWGTLCECTTVTDDNKIVLNMDKLVPLDD